MCGVFGLIGKEPITGMLLQGMSFLQHRGQDAAGIFTYNTETGTYATQKKQGLLAQAFPSQILSIPDGNWGIGHLRYPTAGAGSSSDIQPHLIALPGCTLALVHNGNIVNYLPLKNKMIAEGTPFQTTSDTEVILHLFHNKLSQMGDCSFDSICAAVEEIYTHVCGSYSILGIITGKGLFAFRDPWGFRPLLHGIINDTKSHLFASETAPLSYFKAVTIENIEPGEVIFIDPSGKLHHRRLTTQRHAHCSFEFNYFAKPNSTIENREVYQVRLALGKTLAKNVQAAGIEIDAIVPIPDSGRVAALALSRALNIPLDEGFVKQDYVGRTFIMPSQNARQKAVSRKLLPVSSVFKGKKILLVDDSIVRGTVSRHVVDLVRRVGATHVHFASTYPPIRYPCFYGIDFPRPEELIARGDTAEKTSEEIAQEIGADSVIYNSVEDLKNGIGLPDLCTACLDGKYPTEIEGATQLQNLRLINLAQLENTCKP